MIDKGNITPYDCIYVFAEQLEHAKQVARLLPFRNWKYLSDLDMVRGLLRPTVFVYETAVLRNDYQDILTYLNHINSSIRYVKEEFLH